MLSIWFNLCEINAGYVDKDISAHISACSLDFSKLLAVKNEERPIAIAESTQMMNQDE
jgi:hypothetical protein